MVKFLGREAGISGALGVARKLGTCVVDFPTLAIQTTGALRALSGGGNVDRGINAGIGYYAVAELNGLGEFADVVAKVAKDGPVEPFAILPVKEGAGGSQILCRLGIDKLFLRLQQGCLDGGGGFSELHHEFRPQFLKQFALLEPLAFLGLIPVRGLGTALTEAHHLIKGLDGLVVVLAVLNVRACLVRGVFREGEVPGLEHSHPLILNLHSLAGFPSAQLERLLGDVNDLFSLLGLGEGIGSLLVLGGGLANRVEILFAKRRFVRHQG